MEGAALAHENFFSNYVAQFKELLHASDSGLRIIISLLIGYPLAFFYRNVFVGKSPASQHLFFSLCGLLLCYFNFGWDLVHSLANILLIYLLLLIAGGTAASVILAFVINMGYLCMGYYWTMSESYSIKWTTPHCVLCLRLIGLVADVYDGKMKQDKLSAEQRESALAKKPSLLEIGGYTYFFGGFLVGPQFSMRRYLDFVNGKFLGENKKAPDSIREGFKRLVLGLGCVAIYQAFAHSYPDSTLVSPQFLDSSFWTICLYVIVWSKVMLYKYVGCWLITEGTCILTGLTHNGKDRGEGGAVRWDACANICLWNYEATSTCQDLVTSFNVNTNKWMAKYVFKRLKFLGNKDFSQVATLAFLALWHGLYSGYFANFFLEFFLIKFEREASSLPVVKKVAEATDKIPGGPSVLWVVKKIYVQFVLGYALIGFCLFSYTRYMPVYKSMYFCVHIFSMILWPALFQFIRPRASKKSD